MDLSSVAVIVPAYNEQRALGEVLDDLRHLLVAEVADYQIIVVNDGSVDGTGRVADRFPAIDPRIEVVHHSKNLGLGRALQSGIERLAKERWTWLPGDGEICAGELKKLLSCAKRYPLVISYPVDKDLVRSFFRRCLSGAYRRVLTLLFGHSLQYYNGPVIYPRSVTKHRLISTGFSATAELLIRALDSGLSFIEIPLTLSARNGGRSKAISLQVLSNLVLSWSTLWWNLRAKRFLRSFLAEVWRKP